MTTRRRRWAEVHRRTAFGEAETDSARGQALDDAGLFNTHETATRSIKDAGARAERVASLVARQRVMVESAAERANQVAARSEGLGPQASRIQESFERLGVVALNAGLESARTADPYGRALQLLSEEIRANVARGAEAAVQLERAASDIALESTDVRQRLEASRVEVAEVGKEAAELQAETASAGRALEELGARLRRATGTDPETARLIATASEHAVELTTALSALSAAPEAQPLALALESVLEPLARLLAELKEKAPEDGDEGRGGGAT